MEINNSGFSLSASYVRNNDMNLQDKIQEAYKQKRVDQMYGRSEKEVQNSYAAPSPEGTGRFVDTMA